MIFHPQTFRDDRGKDARREGGPMVTGSPHIRISGGEASLRGENVARHSTVTFF